MVSWVGKASSLVHSVSTFELALSWRGRPSKTSSRSSSPPLIWLDLFVSVPCPLPGPCVSCMGCSSLQSLSSLCSSMPSFGFSLGGSSVSCTGFPSDNSSTRCRLSFSVCGVPAVVLSGLNDSCTGRSFSSTTSLKWKDFFGFGVSWTGFPTSLANSKSLLLENSMSYLETLPVSSRRIVEVGDIGFWTDVSSDTGLRIWIFWAAVFPDDEEVSLRSKQNAWTTLANERDLRRYATTKVTSVFDNPNMEV